MSCTNEKLCKRCNESKDLSEFRIVGEREYKKGLLAGSKCIQYDPMCYECRKASNREYMRTYKPKHPTGVWGEYAFVFCADVNKWH